MMGTLNCIYETPCGWCSKWDKKCDRKTKEAKFTSEDKLTGFTTVKRKPWKPKDEEEYWLVDQCGNVVSLNWMDNFLCITNYKIGNCYRTCEEAEANRDKWIEFYKSDEVLEV